MVFRMRAIFLKLCLTHVTLATTFQPNCTIPSEGSNYVAGPNVRSTLSIFWSAMYTIFVCTWAVQHLNLPAQDQEPRTRRKFNWRQIWKSLVQVLASWRRSWGALWRKFWRRLKWMLVTILLPEFLVGKALGDYISACEFENSMNDDEWTVTHGFFADSGGFLLKLQSDCIAINTAQLVYLVQEGYINTKPPISEAEIIETGQSDFFAKLSAMVQLLWLVIQLIARKILNLPSATLEISALSFAICSLITYALWSGKPQNPQIATEISLRDDIHLDLDAEQQLEEKLSKLVGGSFFAQSLFPSKDTRELAETIPNDRYNWNSYVWKDEYGDPNPPGRKENYFTLKGEDVGFVIGAVILGACHCTAWNFDFPTPIERVFWRVAAIVITIVMPIYYTLWLGLYFVEKASDFRVPGGDEILAWLAFSAYGLSRLYLLGAAFRDLFFLPPEAFVSTWSVSFPHFG